MFNEGKSASSTHAYDAHPTGFSGDGHSNLDHSASATRQFAAADIHAAQSPLAEVSHDIFKVSDCPTDRPRLTAFASLAADPSRSGTQHTDQGPHLWGW